MKRTTYGRFRSSRRCSYLFPITCCSLAKGRSSAHIDPKIRFDIARSLSPLLLRLCLQSRPGINFLLSSLYQFPFVIPDVILRVFHSLSRSLPPPFLPSSSPFFISAFRCPLFRFYLLFYEVYITLEKRCLMAIISLQFAHNANCNSFYPLAQFPLSIFLRQNMYIAHPAIFLFDPPINGPLTIIVNWSISMLTRMFILQTYFWDQKFPIILQLPILASPRRIILRRVIPVFSVRH